MMIKEMPDITEPVEVFGFSTAKELVNQTLQHQQYTKPSPAGEEPNIPSGFDNLDQITKGFKKGELTIVATRPGNGKTAFLLSLVHNIAILMEKRVALFSPERSALKVINRLIESTTSHSVDQIRGGLLKESDMAHVASQVHRIATSSIFIDDVATLDAQELLLRCYQVKNKHHADIIFVDSPHAYVAHIQDSEVRRSEQQEMMETLQGLARELNIPVVCFHQMPKPASLINGGLTPSLKELPDCMALQAGTVIFIHRQEYYTTRNENIPKGTVELIIEKHSLFSIPQRTYLKFIESIDTFVNP